MKFSWLRLLYPERFTLLFDIVSFAVVFFVAILLTAYFIFKNKK